jgi:CheY-like chemotaxis protein
MRPPHSILVVENNDVVREAVAGVLRQDGYAVVAVANGREAAEQLRAGLKPDLVVLDMLMPVMDGWQFLQWSWRNGLVASTPVLIMTGTILTREWAESNGCRGFLKKPFEPAQLLAEVRGCLP